MEDDDTLDLDELLAAQPWLERLAYSLVRDPARAEELAQFVLVAGWKQPPRRGALRAWAQTVMRRAVLAENTRSARRLVRESSHAASRAESAALDVAAVLEREELRQRVLEELSALGEIYRSALVLHHVSGLTVPETAERLGVPLETVRTRLRRGKDELWKRLLRKGGANTWLTSLLPLALGWEEALWLVPALPRPPGRPLPWASRAGDALVAAPVLVAAAALLWLMIGLDPAAAPVEPAPAVDTATASETREPAGVRRPSALDSSANPDAAISPDGAEPPPDAGSTAASLPPAGHQRFSATDADGQPLDAFSVVAHGFWFEHLEGDTVPVLRGSTTDGVLDLDLSPLFDVDPPVRWIRLIASAPQQLGCVRYLRPQDAGGKPFPMQFDDRELVRVRIRLANPAAASTIDVSTEFSFYEFDLRSHQQQVPSAEEAEVVVPIPVTGKSGSGSIVARAAGHSPGGRFLTPAERPSEVEIVLEAEQVTRVQVEIPDGLPVEVSRAEVKQLGRNIVDASAGAVRLRRDDTGRLHYVGEHMFHLDGARSFLLRGLEAREYQLDIVVANATQAVSAPLSGIVRAGAPYRASVEGAVVEFRTGAQLRPETDMRLSSSADSGSCRFDQATGRAAIAALPRARYDLTLAAPGFDPWTGSVETGAIGSTTTVRVDLVPLAEGDFTPVRLRITDASGRVLPRIDVSLDRIDDPRLRAPWSYQRAEWLGDEHEVPTDLLQRAEPGRYDLLVRVPTERGEPLLHDLRIPLELPAEPNLVLRGTTDVGGWLEVAARPGSGPLVPTTFHLFAGETELRGLLYMPSLRADAIGAAGSWNLKDPADGHQFFSHILPAGVYRAVAREKASGRESSKSVEVVAGETTLVELDVGQ